MSAAESRADARIFPRFFRELTIDALSIAEYWESPVCGPARGRLFENILYQYCSARRLTLSERAGSRTLRLIRSASGFPHESDAVITTPDCTLHVELKHLTADLDKNELMIFNQKGLDFLLTDSRAIRNIPLYRLLVSGSPLTSSARRFALLWGIQVVEPGRLPLILLDSLAAQGAVQGVSMEQVAEIRREVPALIAPLQERVARLAAHLGAEGEVLSRHRADRMLNVLQRNCGDMYWIHHDRLDGRWLEDRYDALAHELGLE